MAPNEGSDHPSDRCAENAETLTDAELDGLVQSVRTTVAEAVEFVNSRDGPTLGKRRTGSRRSTSRWHLPHYDGEIKVGAVEGPRYHHF